MAPIPQWWPRLGPLALIVALCTTTVIVSLAGAWLISRGSAGRYQVVATGTGQIVWRIDTQSGKLSFCIPRPSPSSTSGWPFTAVCGPWEDSSMPTAPLAEAKPAPPSPPPPAEPPKPLAGPYLLEEPPPPAKESTGPALLKEPDPAAIIPPFRPSPSR
jgi:hypothetical protein